MSTSQHHFVVAVATELGMEAAVILNCLHSWCCYNRANDSNFHDGNYWTFNTAKSLSELFPYMSQSKLYRSLRALEDAGYIISGNYNKSSYDRTKWYALTEKGYSMYGESIFHECEIDFAPVKNGFCTSEETIPKKNTKKNTSNNNYQSEFEEVWALYPRKQGKKKALASYAKDRKSGVELDTIKEGVRAYARYVKDNKIEARYVKQGSTFFNGRCWEDDYGSANIEQSSMKPSTAFDFFSG